MYLSTRTQLEFPEERDLLEATTNVRKAPTLWGPIWFLHQVYFLSNNQTDPGGIFQVRSKIQKYKNSKKYKKNGNNADQTSKLTQVGTARSGHLAQMHPNASKRFTYTFQCTIPQCLQAPYTACTHSGASKQPTQHVHCTHSSAQQRTAHCTASKHTVMPPSTVATASK